MNNSGGALRDALFARRVLPVADPSEKLDEKLRPVAEAALQPGEQLQGFLIATQSGIFRGGMRALVITDGRLVVQPVNRKFEATGQTISIKPDEIADLRATGLGGGWYNTAISIAEWAGIELTIRTTEGKKIKLSMMRGEGGLIGKLGGGESQRLGVEALHDWVERVPHPEPEQL